MPNCGYILSFLVVSLAVFISYNILNTGMEIPMANYALLFVSSANKVQNYIINASKMVQKVLYININEGLEGKLPILSKQVGNVYSDAIYQTSNLDVRLMLKSSHSLKKIRTTFPVDLVLYDENLEKEIEILKKNIIDIDSGCKFQTIESQQSALGNVNFKDTVKQYEYVALGGTFDRLHNGHKILLSQGVLRSTRHVTVGVTDVNMIQSKKVWELIEPLEKRIKAVLDFLTDINPDLEYNVIPLRDLYGPTKDDPQFQLIVVSEETARSVPKINDKRKENGFAPMDSYVIELAEDRNAQRSDEEEVKVSSSNQRMRLLGTLLKDPAPNPNIPEWPYVIGLAGGIARGKSNIGEKLKAKGAALVNCDFIAHDLYKPGLPLNHTISENFGKDVITNNGEVDRKRLGQIVFNDKEQLNKLNQILWPAVIEEAQRRIQALGEQGYKVVVMEAAVMIKAKWFQYCHQLWSVIIPPDEAVRRLQVRNGLSEKEARQRVEAQPSNLEQVKEANVVFSPYWSFEHTQEQIDKAWHHLQEYLKTRK